MGRKTGQAVAHDLHIGIHSSGGIYLPGPIRVAIVGSPTMTCRRVVCVGLFSMACIAPAALAADARADAKSQVEFGIDVAQRGLWREAIYRWEKAVELDPSYPQAYNNLAVAYE